MEQAPLLQARPRGERLYFLDLIRTVALICILIIHFNAATTGYFAYPSRLFGSWLPGGVYLGDFGSTLFFMVSGAALLYTAKPGTGCLAFYKKRAKGVYPMFWLAWAVCFSIRLVTRPGAVTARAITFPLTVFGLDNFAIAAGWVHNDFACVGEWFLGAILFLYLLFPLLLRGLQKRPLLVWAAALAICLPIHFSGWDHGLVAIHLLEFLFGMTFLQYRLDRVKWVGFTVLIWPLLWAVTAFAPLNGKLVCALAGAGVFALLSRAALLPCISGPVWRRVCSLCGKYSYPVFLLHHLIANRLVQNFDLSVLSRRDTVLLFGAYLLAVAAAARALQWGYDRLRTELAALLRP